MSTIALAMIVKNEQEALPACIRSCRDLIDTWTIVDTGSTDNTPALAEQLLDGIPGQLHHADWKGFAHNRSDLLTRAKDTADYLLCLDADHILEQTGPPPPELTADEYLLPILGGFTWRLPLLLNGRRQWSYKGAAHSYLVSDGNPCVVENLDCWGIRPGPGAAVTREKIERDRILLEQELADEPGNARTVFYLAQTYRDLDMHEQAADMYRRRVRMGGWDQEVFWAVYQEGLIRSWARFEDGVPFLLEAYERRPSRCEPLHVLAAGYHRMGDRHLARMFAETGSRIPMPDDSLFVLAHMYRPESWTPYLGEQPMTLRRAA